MSRPAAAIATLRRSAAWPSHVSASLEAQDWNGVAAALAAGLPANLVGTHGMTLFEHVLEALEARTRPMDRVEVPPAPPILLDAFLRNGLSREDLSDGHATAVSLAVGYGQWDWVDRLLEEGFRVEGAHGSVFHALLEGRAHRVAERGMAPPVDHGAVDAAPTEGREEIFRVANLVGQLADAGASVESVQTRSPTPMPPLSRAILQLDEPVTAGLIQAGADLTVRPPGVRHRPFELAISRGHEGLVSLVAAGGAPLDPDPGRPASETLDEQPLILAARLGLPALVVSLAELLGPERVHRYGSAAMHAAAACGQVPAMRALRRIGVSYAVDLPGSGDTALHQAALAGQAEVLGFLTRRGQRWDRRNSAGLSAEDVLRAAHPDLLARFGLAPRRDEGLRMLSSGRRAGPRT